MRTRSQLVIGIVALALLTLHPPGAPGEKPAVPVGEKEKGELLGVLGPMKPQIVEK